MVNTLRLLLGTVLQVFRARRALLLENLALRQQLVALRRRRPRPRLAVFDKVFWILARPTSKKVAVLTFQMMAENPSWGAPRIHGELLMLGFDLSERTISRWMKRMPRNPDPVKRWLAFLRNHREAIAVMDFFTVPTVTFSVLYCSFLISHDRRRVLHCNVTRHPTSLWIVQQLREAFTFESGPRFLIFDRDAK